MRAVALFADVDAGRPRAGGVAAPPVVNSVTSS